VDDCACEGERGPSYNRERAFGSTTQHKQRGWPRPYKFVQVLHRSARNMSYAFTKAEERLSVEAQAYTSFFNGEASQNGKRNSKR
jgi:hypothetical protein